jgi:hypothetical protein
MRTLAAVSLLVLAAALPAAAQDRYGGMNAYAAPGAQPQQPQRVLSWPGKTIPAPPVAPTSPSAYYAGNPAYGATLQPAPYAQGRGAPIAPYAYQRNTTIYPPQAYAPQPYPAQPYPAQPYPQPPQAPVAYQPYPPQAAQGAPVQGQAGGYAPMGVYMPPPNNQQQPTASAPSGVYPAQPGYPQPGYPVQGLPANAYPPAPFPQGPVPAAPFPTPQAANPQMGPQMGPQTQNLPVPPNSIYSPTPQASGAVPAEPTQPQLLAMNSAPAPAGGSKLYSVHRPFGLEPDHPTVSPEFFGESVDLAEPPPPVGGLRTTASGGKTTRAAELRAMQDDQDFGPNAD